MDLAEKGIEALLYHNNNIKLNHYAIQKDCLPESIPEIDKGVGYATKTVFIGINLHAFDLLLVFLE